MKKLLLGDVAVGVGAIIGAGSFRSLISIANGKCI
jgi:hypothetical protein